MCVSLIYNISFLLKDDIVFEFAAIIARIVIVIIINLNIRKNVCIINEFIMLEFL